MWRTLSVFCAVMSCTVVWSETLFSVKRVDLSVFSWLVNGPGDIPYVFSVCIIFFGGKSCSSFWREKMLSIHVSFYFSRFWREINL